MPIIKQNAECGSVEYNGALNTTTESDSVKTTSYFWSYTRFNYICRADDFDDDDDDNSTPTYDTKLRLINKLQLNSYISIL